jgi:biotin synthase
MNDFTPIDAREAEELLACEGAEFYALMARAGAARERYKGRGVTLCGILNAKSGRCPEDCAFCAQSAHHRTGAPLYPLVGAGEMVDRAREVESMGAREYSIVTSGSAVRSEREIDEICKALACLREEGRLLRCASLGNLPEETLARLKEAGLTNYHHNLETARSFFPAVCTTHDYEEDVETVRRAKGLGLKVCCGGIFGLGESRCQRVELAETLRELDMDSVPLNFLNPIPGTPLEGKNDLTPVECLKIVAVFRLMMPEKDIYVCGGREVNLRDLQSWIFMAGANGMMVGNYLTTSGRDPALDLAMIHDLGLEVLPCGAPA